MKELENNLLTNKLFIAQSGIITVSSFSDLGAGLQLRYFAQPSVSHSLEKQPGIFGFAEIGAYTYALPIAQASSSTGYVTQSVFLFVDTTTVSVQVLQQTTTPLTIKYYLYLDTSV